MENLVKRAVSEGVLAVTYGPPEKATSFGGPQVVLSTAPLEVL